VRDVVYPLTVAAAGLAIVEALRGTPWAQERLTFRMLCIALPLACFSFKDRPLRFGLGFAAVLAVLSAFTDMNLGRPEHRERDFYGVKTVLLDPARGLRLLMHGNTNHGMQSLDPARADEPLAYYHPSGPVGDVFSVMRTTDEKPPVAVVGLGVGAMAAYAQAGQEFTFFEIDPAIERLARDARWFSFLSRCRGDARVVLGDGRLTLARRPDRHYGLIVLDTFSSDSVPSHMLTREAVALYASKLREGGLLLFHVSNRFLAFEPLLGNLARQAGLACRARFDGRVGGAEQRRGKLPSHYVVMARREDDLKGLANDPRWRRIEPRPDLPVWTDQYCDLVSLLVRGRAR
jgi:hypothetical protein